MDPLSVTSGVVGIVAFAFQLAKTASKVKKAVEVIKFALKEARELIERLAMLEAACQLIGFHLEQRESLQKTSSPPSLNIISQALAQFLAKAQVLEQMLSALSASDGLNQIPQSKFGTVSRLRLVLGKDKISSMVQEIDRVISLLQFMIQVDMWTSTLVPARPSSLSSNDIEVMDESPKIDTGSSPLLNNSAPSQYAVAKFRRSRNQQYRTFRYLGYITWTITDGWIGDDDDDDANHIAYRKGRITFQLPFTSTQYSMHYDGGMGTPSYALNVAHIIDKSSALGRRLFRLMRPDGNPEELRELISSRKLSIYSVYRWDDEDFNLFFMAVAKRWARGCRYLLQHDFRQKFEEDETPKARFFWASSGNEECQVTETLLSVRLHDMRDKDAEYLLDTAREPSYFGRYLKVFLKYPAIDHSDLLSQAWKTFVNSVFVVDSDSSSWIPALRTFIEHGVNLHQPCDSDGPSAYTTILNAQVHPFEADDKAYSWLEMLKTCGVNISSYLETESTLIDKFGFNPYTNGRKMKKITLDFDGLPMPSWRWELPTESSIIEVMEEFRNLGPGKMELEPFWLDPEGPDDFKSWKAENLYPDWSQFPFLLSPLDLVNVDDDILYALWHRETYNLAVEIRDKRIARRQAKKWRKARAGDKPLSNKMPGTWVE